MYVFAVMSHHQKHFTTLYASNWSKPSNSRYLHLCNVYRQKKCSIENLKIIELAFQTGKRRKSKSIVWSMNAEMISFNLMLVNFIFFHNSSLWNQQVQFPANAWDSDSQIFFLRTGKRRVRLRLRHLWKVHLSITRFVSKQVLGRDESLLCLAGQRKLATATQAADSTQILTVKRSHLRPCWGISGLLTGDPITSYCPPTVWGTSCSRFPSFPALKVAQLSESCGLLTGEQSSAKLLSEYLQ